jgi:phosphoenolpyruvate---glycerone phosphotransferase subunit DhaL
MSMASADSLVALFDAMTQNIQQDREHLNKLDRSDGDAGDNMAANFQLVTDTLAQTIQQAGPNADVGIALRQASQALQQQGKGATAPIYAQGLADAAQRLQGKTGFTIDDLLPLLQGLLTGTQQASGAPQGQGSLLDTLLPGIMAYMQAKQAGDSDTQALLKALLSLRRGANSTATSPTGWGSDSGRDTTGQIDPGAAGAASLLEGLFGALLKSALGRGQSQPQTPAPQSSSGGNIGDILGQLFGEQPGRTQTSHRR